MESAPVARKNPELPQDPSDAKQDDKQGKNLLKVGAMMMAIGGFLHLGGDHAPATPETPVASTSETLPATEAKDLSVADVTSGETPAVQSYIPPEVPPIEGMQINASDAANKAPEPAGSSVETFTLPLAEGDVSNPGYSAPEAVEATNLNDISEPQGSESSVSASPLAESQNVEPVSPETIPTIPEEPVNKDQSPTPSPESELGEADR